MDRWIAAFLQASALGLFFTTGVMGEEMALLLVPGIGCSVASMFMWGRREQLLPRTPPEVRPPSDSLLARMQESLLTLQSEVAQLRDERDFLNRLYAPAETVGSRRAD